MEKRLVVALLYILLMALSGANSEDNPTASPGDGDVCEQCQKVLYITSVYYNKQRSKPFLRRKVKHLCKRYYQYRRHCLATLVPKAELIACNIDNAIAYGEYHPLSTCATVSECNRDEAPMNFSRIDVDDLDGSGLDLFFDID